jgi:hypothetical protein
VQGSVRFTGQGQTAYIRYVPSPPPDLTGRTLTGWVYVESTTVSVQLQAYAQCTLNLNFQGGASTTVKPGDPPMWIPVTFVLPSTSASWDPTSITQFGISITAVSSVPDAGTSTSVIDVDDYSVQ